MVLDTETLEPLHELSDEGKSRYKDLLETSADEILWKHEHPCLATVEKLVGSELFDRSKTSTVRNIAS